MSTTFKTGKYRTIDIPKAMQAVKSRLCSPRNIIPLHLNRQPSQARTIASSVVVTTNGKRALEYRKAVEKNNKTAAGKKILWRLAIIWSNDQRTQRNKKTAME